MFKLIECEGVVRIPPSMMDRSLKDAVLEVLRREYTGQVLRELGVVVSVLDAEASKYGVILPSDGALYHKARFKMLVYQPAIQEVVEGEVTVVEASGLLVRIGPVEGYVHRSQILDEVVSYSREQSVIIGEKSGKVLRKGDGVRARIVAVSYGGRKQSLRVQLTMKQPFLGKLEWIEEELAKIAKAAKKVGGH
ncbi:MAG: DNA-directed RNA polymerase [Thermoprotei archaeon]|nr:MAG: DNA-directed RNA polymerase [Thermoprotei archaeon]